jgi:hypothetical protein
MLTPERTGLLKSFLGNLPESVAARLARAVEIDRLSDGKMLPHEMILEGLRPVLRRAAGSDRTPTPLRLFCQPFEDLFSTMPRTRKQKGRIGRDSAALVWTWLSLSVLPDEVRTYSREFKDFVVTGRHTQARARAAAFWKLSGDAMRVALADAAKRQEARAQFGSDDVLADAEEMANLLLIGDAVADLQAKLPKFTHALNEDLLWQLREIYERVLATSPDSAAYVGVVAMNRLTRPWEALKLAGLISQQTQDTKISSTDMGLIGEIIFSDIEAHQVAVRAARHPEFDADALVRHLTHFTTLSTGIVKGIEIRRDGVWGQRLIKDRAALAETMDDFMERAPDELDAALPTTGDSPAIADFARKVDPDRIARAERYVRLVAGCRPFANAASFGASQKKAEEAMMHLLRNYNEDLIKELCEPEGAQRALAEKHLDFLANLTAVLCSEEEAEQLRRRARSALAAQAAA